MHKPPPDQMKRPQQLCPHPAAGTSADTFRPFMLASFLPQRRVVEPQTAHTKPTTSVAGNIWPCLMRRPNGSRGNAESNKAVSAFRTNHCKNSNSTNAGTARAIQQQQRRRNEASNISRPTSQPL
ncbi:hypothetical protein TRVL_08122 [Trypanosoma vivax]|nr:hypothetical protein TRVL_08122 [Trypanosoma vivax]